MMRRKYAGRVNQSIPRKKYRFNAIRHNIIIRFDQNTILQHYRTRLVYKVHRQTVVQTDVIIGSQILIIFCKYVYTMQTHAHPYTGQRIKLTNSTALSDSNVFIHIYWKHKLC